ncbi:MAG: hypothetical protein M3Q97_01075, partial [Bacteroidota bacterium]|nr:hypothetical protein [Bacteroidota bacterium]
MKKYLLTLIVAVGFFTLSAQQTVPFQKVIGGTGADHGQSICEMADNGFLILSVTNSTGAGGYDLMLSRTDNVGKVKWSKTYGGAADEGVATGVNNVNFFSSSLVQAEDSTFLIVSQTK